MKVKDINPNLKVFVNWDGLQIATVKSEFLGLCQGAHMFLVRLETGPTAGSKRYVSSRQIRKFAPKVWERHLSGEVFKCLGAYVRSYRQLNKFIDSQRN
jgi:hypothetical protein